MTRRMFLALTAGTFCGVTLGVGRRAAAQTGGAETMPFSISLAEWSLVQTLHSGAMTNLDFPRVAKREFNIDCIEFVDQFFADKARDLAYLQELKARAEGEGVRMNLIMIDTNGPLGAALQADRDAAVEKTFAWIDAAKFLGCGAVRVNAYGDGDADELRGRVAESCAKLADYAAPLGLNVLIENHGNLSSDADWLVSVMQAVNKPNFGTLPDFGNFPSEADRYDAIEKMMPYAKAVSAKATAFTPDGQVADTDYNRMMRIVRDGGYSGYVGVESGAPAAEGEAAAIKNTRDQLIAIRDLQSLCKPIFNGRDLAGWVAVEGGDWVVENGTLIGRNGRNWSTNPETTGSWLRTEAEFGDFRLEFQYAINAGGNSGVFFRSGPEKNPAFTGFEMQITDHHGQPPHKHAAGAIYDVVAPDKNLVRPAGQWNTATIMVKGATAQFEINGQQVLHYTGLDRSPRGYIGLQNHDEKSEVRFRNIRVQDI